MKILHLISNRWNSAISEYALSFARSMEIRGAAQRFVLLSKSPLVQRLATHELPFLDLPQLSLWPPQKVRQYCNDFAPDWVISYGGPETFWQRCLGLPKKTQFWRVIGSDDFGKRAFSRFLLRMAYAHLHRIIIPSRVVELAVRPRIGDTIPVSLIPLGIDPESFFFEAALSRQPTLILLGRLDPVKGHRSFLTIFSQLLRQIPGGLPKPKLCIIGEGANLTPHHINNWCHELGLTINEEVELIPTRVNDLRKRLSEATLGIVPSLGSEFICRVGEEFLLCGLPLFVSRAGALPELLLRPDFGQCYDPRTESCEAIADKLATSLRLAWQETTVSRLERSEFAKESFSFEAMGRSLESLFSSEAETSDVGRPEF